MKTKDTKQLSAFSTAKEQMEAVTSISPATRKWLVALGMAQDLRDFCHMSQSDGPVDNHDNELRDAIQAAQEVINKCLTEQIHMSILGLGNANNEVSI